MFCSVIVCFLHSLNMVLVLSFVLTNSVKYRAVKNSCMKPHLDRQMGAYIRKENQDEGGIG